MPSRKKSYRKRGSRKGAKAGKAPKRRSLRFTPKFVIKERADTIEDTLNETMGKTSYRIPGDVANIIQGYEGGKYLYFAYDPELAEFTYSSTTPLKGGDKVIVSYNPDDDMEPYVYFIEAEMSARIKNGGVYYTNSVSLALVSNIQIEDEDDEHIKVYIFTKHYPSFISSAKRKFGDNNISSGINMISSSVKKIFHNPVDDHDLGIKDFKVIYENVMS